MKRKIRVTKAPQGNNQQQQIQQIIQSYAQMNQQDPNEVMKQLQQMNSQQQQQAISQMAQSVQQGGTQQNTPMQAPQPQVDPQEYAYGGTTGDQRGYALVYNKYAIDDSQPSNEQSYRDSLPEAPEGTANVNAEKNEMVMADYAGDGIPQLMNVNGPSHANGGKDIHVPDNGFIFSDTQKMKIGGEILAEFGKSKDTKQKYTPATLAKQYDLNFFKDKLKAKDADKISNDTAALMLENNQNKLAKLALVQESKKGFPNGIPDIAKQLLQGEQQDVQDGTQMAKYGGLIKAEGGFSFNAPFDPPNKYGRHVRDNIATVNPLTGEKSRSWNAMTDFTGSADYAKRVGYDGPIDLSSQSAIAKTNKNIQQFVQTNYPSIVAKYHASDSYGMPNAGVPVDGNLGKRWQSIANDINTPVKVSRPSIPNMSLVPPIGQNQPLSPYIPQTYQQPNVPQIPNNGLDPSTPTFTKGVPSTMTPAFWDKVGLLNAATRPIDHIRPQLFSPNVQVTPPNFVDNRAEIQQLQSVAGANNDVIQNTSSGAIARANSMMNQGRLAAPINQSNQQMNNTNIGIANDFNRYKDQVLNQNSAQKTGAMAQYTQMNDMFKANLSKEKQMKLADTTIQGQNMTNNMTGMMAMQAKYPNYNFNWSTPMPSVNYVPGNADVTSGGGNTTLNFSTLSSEFENLFGRKPVGDELMTYWKSRLGKNTSTYKGEEDSPQTRSIQTRQ
jgi:hypothetical protein